MISTNGGAFARLVAGGAAAATALAGFTIGLAAPAHAAVTISGSTVDTAGNYVDGRISIYKFSDLNGDGTVGPFEYDIEPSVATQGGAFDLALEDGTYKLYFRPNFESSELQAEYYRDKADLATADFVTVAGAGQVLPAWTIDAVPTVFGTITTTDGRPVDNATCRRTPLTTTHSSPATRPTPRARSASAQTEAVKLRFSRLRPEDQEVPGDGVLLRQGGPRVRRRGRSRHQRRHHHPGSRRLHLAVASPATPVPPCTGSRSARTTTVTSPTPTASTPSRARPPVPTIVCSSPTRSTSTSASTTTTSPSTSTAARSPLRRRHRRSRPGRDRHRRRPGAEVQARPDGRRPQRHRPRPARWCRSSATTSSPTTRRPTRSTVRSSPGRSPTVPGGYAFTDPRPRRRRDRVQDRGRRRARPARTATSPVAASGPARSTATTTATVGHRGCPRSSTSSCRSPAASPVRSPARPVASPDVPQVAFYRRRQGPRGRRRRHKADGTYETRDLWPGDYTVMFGADRHVPRVVEGRVAARGRHHRHGQARPGGDRHLRRPGARRSRPSSVPTIEGDAVGRQDPAPRHRRVEPQMADIEFTYEWLVGSGRRDRPDAEAHQEEPRRQGHRPRHQRRSASRRARPSPRPPSRSATSRR